MACSYNKMQFCRFSHIVKGQFYGHTHTDELKIFYDENGTAINIGYNGASLTPYKKYNPNYKIITVDPYSFVSTVRSRYATASTRYYLYKLVNRVYITYYYHIVQLSIKTK